MKLTLYVGEGWDSSLLWRNFGDDIDDLDVPASAERMRDHFVALVRDWFPPEVEIEVLPPSPKVAHWWDADLTDEEMGELSEPMYDEAYDSDDPRYHEEFPDDDRWRDNIEDMLFRVFVDAYDDREAWAVAAAS